jgi:hypothetical protein
MLFPDSAYVNDLHEAAFAFAARGWRVLQCHPRAKKPIVESWQNIATTDPAVISQWWTLRPEANIGVLLGPQSGLIDVEVDSPEAERELGLLLGEDAPVVPCFSGKRGKHRLFARTDDLPEPPKAVFKYREIEFRTGNGGKGCQSVFPPSVHPSGHVYVWLPGLHPDEVDPQPFPARALDIVRKGLAPAPSTTVREPDELLRKGCRNARLTSMAGSMRRAGFHEEAIAGALLAVNAVRCDPPLSEREVLRIAKSISRYEPDAPPLSAAIYGGVILNCDAGGPRRRSPLEAQWRAQQQGRASHAR